MRREYLEAWNPRSIHSPSPQALVDSLSGLLEHERGEAEAQQAQLKQEMEEVLGELAVMEEQECRRQGETDLSLQRLQQENHDLAQQLIMVSAALERWDIKCCLLGLNNEF